MKKAIKINISGFIFHIDEDAYEKLQKYLDAIARHFGDKEGSKEIINDIEARIAELFQAKASPQKEVINLTDVEEVIAVMGDPEDFGDVEDDEKEEPKMAEKEEKFNRRSNRRLYRDPEGAVLGGVCTGLSAYFNVDVVWIRIAMLLLLFFTGIGFILYLILWIATPSAKTAAQRLEMRGEDVTISNIEKSVKEEYENVKSNFTRIRQSKAGDQVQGAFGEIFHALGMVIQVFVKVIIGIIGVFFVFIGSVILIALLSVILFKHPMNFGPFSGEAFSLTEFLNIFVNPNVAHLAEICFFLIIAIPVISIVYGGIKLIFKLKTNDKMVGISALLLWFVSAAIFVVLLLSESRNFSEEGKTVETFNLKTSAKDTLYVRINNVPGQGTKDKHIDMGHHRLNVYINSDTRKFYGRPAFTIEKAEDSDFELVIKKNSQGETRKDAIDNAKQIIINYFNRDSVLLLDPSFILPESNKWRAPEVRITLKVPENKVVFLDKGLSDIIEDVQNVTDTYDQEMLNKKWIMTKDGLSFWIKEKK
jgi:phage shock protein PspC (stress-responsive transcriptional regulator)